MSSCSPAESSFAISPGRHRHGKRVFLLVDFHYYLCVMINRNNLKIEPHGAGKQLQQDGARLCEWGINRYEPNELRPQVGRPSLRGSRALSS